MRIVDVSTGSPAPECALCFGPHDPDIHDATVSIHNWFRHEIERRTHAQDFPFSANVEAVAAYLGECPPSPS